MLGTEPDLSEFTITLPVARADANYVVITNCQGVANIVATDVVNRTNTDFLLVATGNLQVGDVMAFVVFPL